MGVRIFKFLKEFMKSTYNVLKNNIYLFFGLCIIFGFNALAYGEANLKPYKPDDWPEPLIVSNLKDGRTSIDPIQDQFVYINVSWINTGDTTAGQHSSSIYLDGSEILRIAVPGLRAKIYLSEEKNHLSAWWEYKFQQPGKHTIKLVVDSDNQIPESNESDNVYEKQIFVVNTHDNTPPSLLSSFPKDGEVDVDLESVNRDGIIMTFSEAIDTSRVQISLSTDSQILSWQPFWSDGDRKLTLKPNSGNELDFSKRYTLRLSRLADEFGNETFVTISFTTMALKVQLTYIQLDASAYPKIVSFVNVTNSQGKPIAGLSKSDFIVREDGINQEITMAGSSTSPPIEISYITQNVACQTTRTVSITVVYAGSLSTGEKEYRSPECINLKGKVTDADTGKPIAGANVSVDGTSVKTDAFGEYGFRLIHGDYIVTASADKYVSQKKTVAIRANILSVLDFKLELKQGTVTGIVKDASTDSPISDATLKAGNAISKTDTSGKYQISLKPGEYTITASASKYVSQNQKVTIKPEETSALDFKLEPSQGIIAGTVTDAGTGVFIPIATVKAGNSSTKTDIWGSYRFSLKPGEYTVTVSADRYVSQDQKVIVKPEETSTLDFKLELKNGLIAGNVTDINTGKAIANATVKAGNVFTQTDVSGNYYFSIKPGEYTATALANKYVIQEQKVTVRPEETTTLNFRLELKQGSVTGVVIDTDTDKAISGAIVKTSIASTQTDTSGEYQISLKPGDYTITVTADKYVQQEQEVTVKPDEATILDFKLVYKNGIIAGTVMDIDTGRNISGVVVKTGNTSTQTDGSGKYQLSLRPGEYIVTASMDKYISQDQKVSVKPDETTTLDFQLELKPGIIIGTVADLETGRIISGVTIRADGFSTQTDASGEYQFGLKPGEYTVTASSDKYVSQEQKAIVMPEEATTLNFRLELKQGGITGTVTDAETGKAISAIVKADTISTQTDASGKYEFNLKPGEYTITAIADKYVQQEQKITIKPDETTTMDFRLVLENGIIAGTVTDLDTGRPISEVTIRTDDTFTKTDALGNYQLGLKPGEYILTASADKYVSQDQKVKVKPEETTTIDFRLEIKNGIVAGTVIDLDNNKPISEVTIKIGDISTQTDTAGKYQLSLKPGEYTVTASSDKYISQDQKVTIKTEEITTLNFMLELKSGTISGSVTDLDTGKPISGAAVMAGGTSVGTDASGNYQLPIKPGDYTVTVLAEKYVQQVRIIAVKPDEIAKLDFKLELKQGNVTGIVINADTGEPIPGATVKIGVVSIQTDTLGKYQLTLKPGDYAVTASADKYIQKDQKVSVKPGETTNLDFQLETENGIATSVETYYDTNTNGDNNKSDSSIYKSKPYKNALLPNYPNPFNPETWIPFVLADMVEVEIRIYDINGHLVRKLERGTLKAGYYIRPGYATYWDGRSESGELATSGVYFYSIRAGKFTESRKMIISR